MQMQVHLEAHDLQEAIKFDALVRKKDRQSFIMILGAQSEDIMA